MARGVGCSRVGAVKRGGLLVSEGLEGGGETGVGERKREWRQTRWGEGRAWKGKERKGEGTRGNEREHTPCGCDALGVDSEFRVGFEDFEEEL